MLSRTLFTGNDGYQNLLVFAPMLNSLTLDSNENIYGEYLYGILLTGYRPEYHRKKSNHLILTLNRINLPNDRVYNQYQ